MNSNFYESRILRQVHLSRPFRFRFVWPKKTGKELKFSNLFQLFWPGLLVHRGGVAKSVRRTAHTLLCSTCVFCCAVHVFFVVQYVCFLLCSMCVTVCVRGALGR